VARREPEFRRLKPQEFRLYSTLRPILFALEPEGAHGLTLGSLRFAGAIPPALTILRTCFRAPQRAVEAFGLKFGNPVGLAAGYDKDAIAVPGLASLGFGHIEVGTVTARPQAGNPRPRVFRLVEDEGLVNRLGFPSRGAGFVADRLRGLGAHRSGVILGVNIGKNRETPLADAAGDYLQLMGQFQALADYLVINISSPNTEGLRKLQGRDLLDSLLREVARARRAWADSQAGHVPILVKLGPDLSEDELAEAVGVIIDRQMDGIIATNTTAARPRLASKHKHEAGGLSGAPLREQSERVLRSVLRQVDGRISVVSAGGIMTVEDARRRLDLGATLIQIYTGLIYRGPGLVRAILRGL